MSFVAGRGFTGHEHLPWLSIINMNGRLYDPLIGQFLSPDNFNSDLTSTLSFNRYSYVFNNPLVYSDPTGEIPLGLIYLIGAGILNIADNMINKHMDFEDAVKNSNFTYSHTFNFNSPIKYQETRSNWNNGLSYTTEERYLNNQYNLEDPNSMDDYSFSLQNGDDEWNHSFNFEDSGHNNGYSSSLDFSSTQTLERLYLVRINVDETNQRMTLVWGGDGASDMATGPFVVSTGSLNNTPNGEFKVYWRSDIGKLKELGGHPECHWAVAFKGNFALHTYPGNVWNRPVSGGCVRIYDENIAKLVWQYSIVNRTVVNIYGEWPGFKNN